MTGEQFLRSLVNLDMSQEEAGQLFGYSSRHIRRWEKDQSSIPTSVAVALKLAAQSKLDKRALLKLARRG